MAKLVIEVLNAKDLMPKDGHGSGSPFVQVEFAGQRKQTSTKPKNLYPSWNEKLVCTVKDPNDLSSQTVEVSVYNDGKQGHHKNFLGRVRISGSSVPFSEQEAVVQRYPLDKRGIFSNVKGDIALKVHAVHSFEPAEDLDSKHVNGGDDHYSYNEFEDHYHKEIQGKGRKKKMEREDRTFHSVEASQGGSESLPPVFAESQGDFLKPGEVGSATTVLKMQSPGQKAEYVVVETKPPVAARLGYWGRDKTASTYDLVEPMNFLYVSVVKAMDLPVMDATGSIDPYVEVRVGNYKGVTPHFEKNRNPVWNKFFAFSKERLQSSIVEVILKDKDLSKDDFVGKVTFDIREVSTRVPPDSPLAPQWYKLVDKKGELLKRGDIMLAVWMGTQADEAFPDAWHSDAHSVSQDSMSTTRSKVYFSPTLYYLRVHVFAAQDLVPLDDSQSLDPIVRVELETQGRTTRPSANKGIHPEFNDELMFIAWEPFNENIVVSVEQKDQVLGRVLIPLRSVRKRVESKLPDPQWFALQKPAWAEDKKEVERDKPFLSRILLRLSLDGNYHVIDESLQFSTDLQPAAGQLRKPSIGILEVGILNGRNLQPMKGKEGQLTDAYCVAKYGNKWVRTRTLLNNLHPTWNEQYTWEVYDPCTVIIIGVFDNCHINGKDDAKDKRIGKVRIRISTLETDRVYTHSYPLLVLTSSGLKKNGELHLALRFTCTAWSKMLTQYGKPLLPKMHYVQPIHIKHTDLMRHWATGVVATKLSKAEPPLRSEVVDYMLDVDYHMFSMRKSKATFHRVMLLISVVQYAFNWFNDICVWKNPLTTILIHMLFLILVCYPELILPTFFLYLFVIGLWNYPLRPRAPPHMDAHLSQAENVNEDELEEEFSTFPTDYKTLHFDILRRRYDRIRTVAARVQSVTTDMAMQGERVLSLLSWRDPRATAIFMTFSLICAVFLYITPFQVVALVIGLYVLRHHRFRSKYPPVPVNFFKRLPSRADTLL